MLDNDNVTMGNLKYSINQYVMIKPFDFIEIGGSGPPGWNNDMKIYCGKGPYKIIYILDDKRANMYQLEGVEYDKTMPWTWKEEWLESASFFDESLFEI